MSNILWKNIYLCFPKFSCPTTTPPPPPSPSHQDHSHPPPPTQLIKSTLMIKNLNSLCSDLTSEAEHSTSKSLTFSSDFFSSSEESELADSPPDFATIFASQRFFFSSPGRSNSIIDSSSTATTPDESDTLGTGGVAIQTYSPEPYVDFRRSMQEMVEARQIVDVEADWDYLYELLVCYLTLNPKHTHKFIIAAFADLLISLMPSNTTDSLGQNPESYPRSAVSQPLS